MHFVHNTIVHALISLVNGDRFGTAGLSATREKQDGKYKKPPYFFHFDEILNG